MRKPRFLLAALLFVGILPFILNGFYKPYLAQMPHIYWVVEILTWIVLPSLLVWISFRHELFTLSDVGLHIKIFGRSNWPLFLGTTLVLSILVVWVDAYSLSVAHKLFAINHGAIDFSYRNLVPTSGFPRFLVLLYFCLSAGIVEELYFRGMARLLFPRNLSGSLFYIASTAILFSLIHWEGGVWNLTETLLFGLAMSTLYVLSGNLWPLIIGHAITDYLWFS